MKYLNDFSRDIYFLPEYGKLNETIEHGVSDVFRYKGRYGEVSHLFIKRKIDVADGELYDLISPYGYGGPLVVSCEPDKRKALCDEFATAFAEYCRQNRIVSEFVRFHPVAENALDFKDMYDVVYQRKTVGTDLSSYGDPVAEEFSKGCRKNIRRALNGGIDFKITESPSDIDPFIDIYYSTMQRDNAGEFYYFKKDYFDAMTALFKKDLIFVEALYAGKTIAAGVYFVSNGIIHIHLSGTLSEYLYLSPAYVLRYAVTLWGKENGYKLIHHGGGRSNREDDSLYTFKKQFGTNTSFDFYIGKKIWDRDAYSMLCKKTGDKNTGFFPQYRTRG